jgi:hypothetical protein
VGLLLCDETVVARELKKQRRGSNLADKALGIDCREDLCEVFISWPVVLGVENRIADAGVALAKSLPTTKSRLRGRGTSISGASVTFWSDGGDPEVGRAEEDHR